MAPRSVSSLERDGVWVILRIPPGQSCAIGVTAAAQAVAPMRKMLLETCLSLAAAVVSVGGVGVLSATTTPLGTSARCATASADAAQPAASCRCTGRRAASPDDASPTAVAIGRGCRRTDAADARAPSADSHALPEPDSNDARRLALLAGLLVGARIGLRRMRLFRSSTPPP
jgi:hypothetical protein